jgi:hypothetical protein
MKAINMFPDNIAVAHATIKYRLWKYLEDRDRLLVLMMVQ